MKIVTFRVFLILFTILNCVACKDKACKSKNVDEFYTEKGEWDEARIPLIKPYEATNFSKDYGWFMNQFLEGGDSGFYNIKKVNVVDGVILIYCENSILNGVDVKQTWRIIVPSKRVEIAFDNHKEYLEYVYKLGFKSEPRLLDIKLIAQYFDDHDFIDWKSINDFHLHKENER